MYMSFDSAMPVLVSISFRWFVRGGNACCTDLAFHLSLLCSRFSTSQAQCSP